MRKGICKYCGEEFEYSNRGKERVHCRKEECLKKAKNEAQKKWYANKVKKELQGTDIRIVSKEENKPQIVYSSKDRSDNRLENGDLGTVRFKILELLNKESKKQSLYDRQDQDFLHKLEGLEELTDTEAINMIVEEKKKREVRRSHKIRKAMLMKMVEGIMKNPNAYVVETIKNRDNFKYKQRVKENETI